MIRAQAIRVYGLRQHHVPHTMAPIARHSKTSAPQESTEGCHPLQPPPIATSDSLTSESPQVLATATCVTNSWTYLHCNEPGKTANLLKLEACGLHAEGNATLCLEQPIRTGTTLINPTIVSHSYRQWQVLLLQHLARRPIATMHRAAPNLGHHREYVPPSVLTTARIHRHATAHHDLSPPREP